MLLTFTLCAHVLHLRNAEQSNCRPKAWAAGQFSPQQREPKCRSRRVQIQAPQAEPIGGCRAGNERRARRETSVQTAKESQRQRHPHLHVDGWQATHVQLLPQEFLVAFQASPPRAHPHRVRRVSRPSERVAFVATVSALVYANTRCLVCRYAGAVCACCDMPTKPTKKEIKERDTSPTVCTSSSRQCCL